MNTPYTKNDSKAELREALCPHGHGHEPQGPEPGTLRNVSARFEDGMLITASGCHFDEITPEHIVETDLDGHYRGPLKPLKRALFPRRHLPPSAGCPGGAPCAFTLGHNNGMHATPNPGVPLYGCRRGRQGYSLRALCHLRHG